MCLPIGLRIPPSGGMAGNAIGEFVMAEILRPLVGISAANAGGANQSQADGVIVRLVRSVLAVGQDGGPELSAHISEIDPLVRGNFELLRFRRGALDGADVPIVGRHL